MDQVDSKFFESIEDSLFDWFSRASE